MQTDKTVRVQNDVEIPIEFIISISVDTKVCIIYIFSALINSLKMFIP